MQIQKIYAIDLFGATNDGIMPSIVFTYDQTWSGLFAVAPPNPPALESRDRPDGRLSLVL
jgi:hypothetical protein